MIIITCTLQKHANNRFCGPSQSSSKIVRDMAWLSLSGQKTCLHMHVDMNSTCMLQKHAIKRWKTCIFHACFWQQACNWLQHACYMHNISHRVVKDVLPDYMHCALLGVTKLLLGLWTIPLDALEPTTTSNATFYLWMDALRSFGHTQR